MFGHALLQDSAQTTALPLRVDHEGGFGDVGRRVDKVAGLGHYLRVLTRSRHGDESDFILKVDIAQALHLLARQAVHFAKKTREDVALGQPVKQGADRLAVG